MEDWWRIDGGLMGLCVVSSVKGDGDGTIDTNGELMDCRCERGKKGRKRDVGKWKKGCASEVERKQ